MKCARPDGVSGVPPSSEDDRVRDLAMRLRRALDSIPKSELPDSMREFPHGACGDASHLMGALLADSGLDGFEFISAVCGMTDDNTWTSPSHAWLACGSLIVDITADQFPDAPAAVIVARNSPWHTRFCVEYTRPSDFRASYGPGNGDLQALYLRLRSMLDAGPEAYS